ncbi:hypothetical protein D1872_297420 [compost metagenome]
MLGVFGPLGTGFEANEDRQGQADAERDHIKRRSEIVGGLMRRDRQGVEPAHQQRHGGEDSRFKEDGKADRHADLHQFFPLCQRDGMEFAENAVTRERLHFMHDPQG